MDSKNWNEKSVPHLLKISRSHSSHHHPIKPHMGKYGAEKLVITKGRGVQAG